jgi:hypothetical protein
MHMLQVVFDKFALCTESPGGWRRLKVWSKCGDEASLLPSCCPLAKKQLGISLRAEAKKMPVVVGLPSTSGVLDSILI